MRMQRLEETPIPVRIRLAALVRARCPATLRRLFLALSAGEVAKHARRRIAPFGAVPVQPRGHDDAWWVGLLFVPGTIDMLLTAVIVWQAWTWSRASAD